MSDLVSSLITGFFTSIILIFIAYWFWKLYDRPSKRQVELAEERKEKHKEARMWRAVEEEMEREQAKIEAAAIIERKKAEARARAMPPAAGVMQNALAALDSPTDSSEYNEQFKPTTHDGKEIAILQDVSTEIADDSDLLSVENATEVRITDGYFSDELLGELFEKESEPSPISQSIQKAVLQVEQPELAEQAESTTEETGMAEEAEIPQVEQIEHVKTTTEEAEVSQQAEMPQLEQASPTNDEQEMPVDVEWQESQTSQDDEWSVGW